MSASANLKNPQTIRLFPLSGVLLLPGCYLPLHIFEPRYRAMVAVALESDQLIGMVHPRIGMADQLPSDELMPLGCAGEIVECQETPDGRFHLLLRGMERFRLDQELPGHPAGFRLASVSYEPDSGAEQSGAELNLDRGRMVALAERLLPGDMTLSADSIAALSNAELVDALSMHIPLSGWDKQALLQARAGQERAETLMAVLETADAIRKSTLVSTQRH